MEYSLRYANLSRALPTVPEALLIFAVQVVTIAAALRLISLDVPSPSILGESIELTCLFNMEEEKLYSVKWYKDDVEFYRYVPNDSPPAQFLPIPGIRIDLSKSSVCSVFLKNIDLHSAGKYRCEVSGEAPVFDTEEIEKDLQVFVLPSQGPSITGSQSKYSIGDTVNLNCTSAKSKPLAILKWYINDDAVRIDYEVKYSPVLFPDGLESATLALKFTVSEIHFRNGNMRLKCVATVSPMHVLMNEALAFGGLQQTSGLHINENTSRVRDTATIVATPVRWTSFLISILSMTHSYLLHDTGL